LERLPIHRDFWVPFSFYAFPCSRLHLSTQKLPFPPHLSRIWTNCFIINQQTCVVVSSMQQTKALLFELLECLSPSMSAWEILQMLPTSNSVAAATSDAATAPWAELFGSAQSFWRRVYLSQLVRCYAVVVVVGVALLPCWRCSLGPCCPL